MEEPLEIRLGYDDAQGIRQHRTVSITMRTPGHDAELALGFLFSEGIVREFSDIAEVRPCGPLQAGTSVQNVLRVELKSGVGVDWLRLERHFYTSSSCGVCGKTSIAALQMQSAFALPSDGPHLALATVHTLPSKLRAAQGVFDQTGGLHASALFSCDGTLLACREDVGRHNALDKLIGYAWLNKLLPLHTHVLLLSGRVSFELVQKAAMAGIPIVGAVGAPSSLAVELARSVGMSLAGFIREKRFNVYHGSWRFLETTN